MLYIDYVELEMPFNQITSLYKSQCSRRMYQAGRYTGHHRVCQVGGALDRAGARPPANCQRNYSLT